MRLYKVCAVMLSLVLGTTASADIGIGAILMKKQNNTAYFYDGAAAIAKTLRIKDTDGCPYIDSDGKVYISLNGFFSAFGDKSEYQITGTNITITVKGKKCSVPIEKKFIVRGHEDKGYMYVYRIYEDYYIPAELIAVMCGGSVTYNQETGEIVLFTDESVKDSVVNSDKTVKDSLYNKLYSEGFLNNINGSNMYLEADGSTISTIDGAECVVRVGNSVYYTKEYKLYKRVGKEEEKITFSDNRGQSHDLCVYNIINVGDRLYGISTGNAFGKTGRFFSCNLSGGDFDYIGNAAATNLFANGNYIYFMSDSRVPVMYLYDTELRDLYELVVVDEKDESLLPNTEVFAITQDGCVIIEEDVVRFVRFDLPAYECEWIKIRDNNAIRTLKLCNRMPFSRLVSANYDNKEDTLYLIDTNANGTRLIKINCKTYDSKVVKEYDKGARDVDLFRTDDALLIAVILSDGSVDYIK